MDAPVLRIEGLNHRYGSGALRAQVLFDVSTMVQPGEVVLVTGPSGSGKTTLLMLTGCLLTVQEGSLVVLGEELRGASETTRIGLRRRTGWIFQLHNLLPALTAVQNVRTGFVGDTALGGAAADRRARELLAQVGLEHRTDHRPDQLSVGQRQRVAVARALAARPRLVLADEPTAALDRQSGRTVVELLRALASESGTAVVMVTHDDRIFDLGDRVLCMDEGRLHEAALEPREERRA